MRISNQSRSTMLQQTLHHPQMTFLGGKVKRRRPRLPFQVNLRSMLEESISNLQTAILSGRVQRCRAIWESHVDIRATFKHMKHRLYVSSSGSVIEGRATTSGSFLGQLRTLAKDKREESMVASLGRKQGCSDSAYCRLSSVSFVSSERGRQESVDADVRGVQMQKALFAMELP